ncbi:MAG: hypothetical protein U0930_00735 [Pirellulales bacterium]
MDFIPIDHKDSSPDYRSVVWSTVSSQIAESFQGVTNEREVFGSWQFEDYRVLFGTDGVAVFTFPDGAVESVPFRIKPSRLEYSDRDLHLVITQSGRLLAFNGDGSLRLLGVRTA